MKKAVIALVVLVVLAGGTAAFVLTRGKKSSDAQPQTKTTEQQTTTETTTTEPSFSPVSTTGLAFTGTITTEKDGKTVRATIKYDGKGNAEYNSTQNGQSTRVVFTKTMYYTCTKQGCYKFALKDSSGTSFDPSQYQYDDKAISDFKTGATYKGQQSCPSGTCDVWETADFQGRGSATVYIDTATHRITKVESVYSGANATIVFDYQTVTIEIPKDAQEVPAGI